MGTLNPLDIRQIRVRLLTKIAELQPSYATAVPRANVAGAAQANGPWPRVAVIRDAAVSSGIGQFGAIQSAAPSLGEEVSPNNVRDSKVRSHATYPLSGHRRMSV